jgi:hypothetical protein
VGTSNKCVLLRIMRHIPEKIKNLIHTWYVAHGTTVAEEEDDYELTNLYFFFLKIFEYATFSMTVSLFNTRMRTSYSHIHILY